MNKPYQGLETSLYLMKSYEYLSKSHVDAFREEKALRPEVNPNGINYFCAPALLSLNAAIVEGLARSVLVEVVERDINSTYNKGAGKISQSILQKARYEIETQGGWEKLQSQYSTYVGITLQSILGKENFQTMSVLFKLRNIFAHGTTLVEPIAKMHDDEQQFYPYQWQRKLQAVKEYCSNYFGVESITEAMLIHDFPKHFFEITKQVATSLGEEFDGLHERVYVTIHEINVVDFGRKKLYHFM
jgi:hypothetical protein